jgi:cytidine deaminase
MKLTEIQLKIETYTSAEELSPADRELLELADEAIGRAYAPYSHYRVGAALRLDNGEIYTGNNQENAAYPSGLCAERVTMFYAKSKHPEAIIECIAVSAKSDDFKIADAVSPCGSCRQVMAEYENSQEKPIRVIMKGENSPIQVIHTIETLLPLMFHEEELKRKK